MRPLDEYRRKRDFTRSPEPAGTSTSATARRQPQPLSFCVQKHLASHLHYDLRLEHHGVLLSWAIPKGPSLDPATKRLAMHVEDHPIEYGTFEGVIPEGYGAGIVMLWDAGTWTPEVSDVDAALAKGDLKFRLDGHKLKGSWVLVRTRGYGGQRGGESRSWLLIKHRDEWSGERDITALAPLSVKSESDFAEILASDNPDVWRSGQTGSGGPVSGGETGKLLRTILDQAADLKAARESQHPTRRASAPRETATPPPAGARGRAARKTAAKTRPR